MTARINLLGEEFHTYKANLHMHSTTSDGEYPLPKAVDYYREEKYDILAATDHYVTNRVSEIDSGKLLLISGMEFHPVGPRGIILHLLALNVPEDFPDPSQLPYQRAIECVRAAGGECILAHPYWSGLNCTDILQIKNIIAIEVYNASCRYIGKAYNMQVWDNILQMGYPLPAIAVDDMHHAQDFMGGWTMICARENTPEAMMKALKTGAFYASQGPVFHTIRFEDNVFSVECSPCTEVVVMGDCDFGFCGTVPGFNVADIQELKKAEVKEMTSFETKIPVDAGLTYIRCQLKDKNGKYAWSAPIKLGG